MAGLRYPGSGRLTVSDTVRTFQDVRKDAAPPLYHPPSFIQFYRHFGESLNRNKLVERRNLLSGFR